MDPSKRVVKVRTSASAQDFWSRPRDESNILPDFTERSTSVLGPLLCTASETPYGRQVRPKLCVGNTWSPPPPPPSPVFGLGNSRRVEQRILSEELRVAEGVSVQHVARANEHFCSELRRAWKVNDALVNALKEKAVLSE